MANYHTLIMIVQLPVWSWVTKVHCNNQEQEKQLNAVYNVIDKHTVLTPKHALFSIGFELKT